MKQKEKPITRDIKDFLDLKRPKKLTYGLEVEMFLCRNTRNLHVVDSGNDDTMPDELPISLIIEETKEPKYADRIYRDFYPNQLELRTPPHTNPEFMLNDIKDSYNHVQEILDKINQKEMIAVNGFVKTMPSSVIRGMDTTCGTHLHIRPKYLFNTFVNSYPLLIPFMENSQCSPMNRNIISSRQTEDRHISGRNITYTYDSDVSKRLFTNNTNRCCDIIINKNKKSSATDRHRVKTINTIEYRVFDTNWDFEHMKNNIILFAEVLRHLKQDKIIKYSQSLLQNTRGEAIYSRHGYNYIFDKPNTEVIKELSEIFGLEINKFSTPIRNNIYQDATSLRPNMLLEQIKW